MELYIYEDYKEVLPGIDGRALTDMLIIKSLEESGISADKVLRTDKGKPYVSVQNFDEDIYISVSHSGRYFVCVVSRVPVGVDIQQQRKVKADNISRRYFTSDEIRYIDKTGEDGFFFIWTRKEAYCKYTGRGLEEIIKGTQVIGRKDVEFIDFQLEKGMYCSCCMMI